MNRYLCNLIEDFAIALHESLVPAGIIVCTFILLLATAARGATPAMYSLTTQPTILTNKGLTPGSGQNAVNIVGQYHVLDNLLITGGLHGLFFPGGASDITINGVTILNPVPQGGGGYCVYVSNSAGTVDRVDVINSTFTIDEQQKYAQFPARLYGIRYWRFFGCTFTNRGKAFKSSLKIGEGKDVEFYDCKFFGWPPGIGRNNGDPASYLVEDLKFVRCTIDMNDQKPAQPPGLKIVWTHNASFEDSTIIQRGNVGVLDIGNGTEGIVFTRCTISGGSKLGNVAGAKFEGSTYNNAVIP